MLIDVHDLVAGYARPVLGPVSFSLGRGEILGLVGANGCGKSTLLAALLGAARVFSGEVRRAGGLTVTLQTQQQPDVGRRAAERCQLLALTGATATGLPAWLADRLDERLDRLSAASGTTSSGPACRRREMRCC